MKILYLSCHSILEYDELKILENLGISYFSLGSYIDPRNPVDTIRPHLNTTVDPDLLKQAPDRLNMPKEFIDNFDTIIVMHVPQWIYANWENMKHKRVIWRTIGQSTAEIEARMFEYRRQGLQIVRYSPYEAFIPNTAGADALIRFYKDPDEFRDWNGINKQAITIAQDMKHRAEHCNYEAFTQIAEGLPVALYGTKNEGTPLSKGYLSYAEMKQVLRDNRVYIYTGTQPASYTLNFIEALMTGIPVVALGQKHGNSLNIAGQVYEIPNIINNASNGFISDDISVLRKYVKELLDRPDYARKIGTAGRETAIRLFGKNKIQEQWSKFLGLTTTEQK